MAVAPDDVAVPVSEIAANAGDDADGQLPGDQHRPLLDMQLEEAADVLRIELRLSCADALGQETRLRHVLAKRPAGVGPLALIERVGLKQAEGGAAANVRCGKPRELLGPHAHHGDVLPGLPAGAAPARQHRHAGHDARGTVVVAALGYRIEMRAGHDRGPRTVLPRQGQVEVARGVDPLLQRELLADGLHQVVRHLLAFAVGGARHAEAALRMAAQVVEPLSGESGFRLEIAVEICHAIVSR